MLTSTMTPQAPLVSRIAVVRAVAVVVAFIALMVVTARPASARTRSAADPTPAATADAQLPVNLTLGPVHVNVAVPLDVGAVLGRIAPTTPSIAPPTTSPEPVRTTPRPIAKPRPRPTPPHTVAQNAPEQHRPVTTTRPTANGQDVPSATVSTRPPTATRSRTVAQGPVEALQQALRPGSPILLLVLVVLGCGAGTAVVVGAAGHRPKHGPGGTAPG